LLLTKQENGLNESKNRT